jgi:hypothetical protein
MTRKKTYSRMIEGVRRILSFAPIPISLEFRLLNAKSKETLYDWVREAVRPSTTARYFINSATTDYANWGIYDQSSERRHQMVCVAALGTATTVPHPALCMPRIFERKRVVLPVR